MLGDQVIGGEARGGGVWQEKLHGTGKLMDSAILGKSVEREVGCCSLGDLFLLPLLVHLALLGA